MAFLLHCVKLLYFSSRIENTNLERSLIYFISVFCENKFECNIFGQFNVCLVDADCIIYLMHLFLTLLN